MSAAPFRMGCCGVPTFIGSRVLCSECILSSFPAGLRAGPGDAVSGLPVDAIGCLSKTSALQEGSLAGGRCTVIKVSPG